MEALLRNRYDVMGSPSMVQASRMAKERPPDAIVLDLESSLIDGRHDPTGAAALIAPGAGVVCAVRPDSPECRETPRGDCPCVRQPYRAEDLYAAVGLAAASAQPRENPTVCRRRAAPSAARAIRDRRLIGECEALRSIARRIALYAACDAPVLILGESGTGKELAADAIHRASGRGCGPFLPVDCAAISDQLVESTLFGTVRGAFTDAVDKKGAFESARGGTVLLDEIAEMSLPVQAKLLRALETGSGARVGSVETTTYDVRVLSATNAELLGGRCRFRPELLHRIDTLVLEMPALRHHKDDIPVLANSFLADFSPGKTMTIRAVSKLQQWDWPGNVRELRNVVNRAGVLSGDRDEIRACDIEIVGPGKPWQASLF